MDGKQRVLVFGANGTIGRAVVRQLIVEGYQVSAVLRARASSELPELKGAVIRYCDVLDDRSVLDAAFADEHYDVVMSCLASRTGSPQDAWAVDYGANSQILKIAKDAGVGHFVLLSAICVQKPRLAFQHAKLAFEHELTASGLTYSIIRPTAFFKSLSGQLERVAAGKRFIMFGDGKRTRCKPISDSDLARFITSCIIDPERQNRILPIGGPGPAISPGDQHEMLCSLLGEERRGRHIPVAVIGAAIGVLSLGERWSDRLAEKAEYARIAHYYATESMLVIDPETGLYSSDMTPEFGKETLFDHYRERLQKRAE